MSRNDWGEGWTSFVAKKGPAAKVEIEIEKADDPLVIERDIAVRCREFIARRLYELRERLAIGGRGFIKPWSELSQARRDIEIAAVEHAMDEGVIETGFEAEKAAERG